MKNIIWIISIIFLTSCTKEQPLVLGHDFEIDARLPIDSNGYYHLNWLIGNVQTFVTIEAYVGHGYRFVGWSSNTYFDGCTWGYCEPVNVVNSSSYSNEDGMAYTMLGVYEEHIGDTVMVSCGYYEDNVQYLDSLGVIIDE